MTVVLLRNSAAVTFTVSSVTFSTRSVSFAWEVFLELENQAVMVTRFVSFLFLLSPPFLLFLFLHLVPLKFATKHSSHFLFLFLFLSNYH